MEYVTLIADNLAKAFTEFIITTQGVGLQTKNTEYNVSILYNKEAGAVQT